MIRILLAFALLSLVGPLTAAPPNVLFIAVDDLNDWIEPLGGHPDAKTPNIKRLAERGVTFQHAYCAAPACNPSRAALMTGIRPATSGVYHNPQPWRQALPHAVTLAQHFSQHGYYVAGGGKIFHGAYKDPQSWQLYFNRPADPKPKVLPANGIRPPSHFDWGPLPEPDKRMGDHQVVDWAINQLETQHDKPFFIACGIFRPHLPWFAPQPYFDLFPVDSITLPEIPSDDLDDIPQAGIKMARPTGDHKKVMATKNHAKAVQAYLASIAFADRQIGRLLDALNKSPHQSNTIVVLWGDHGWHLGEKQHWRKFALWEEATRVPLIIAAPELAKAGTDCDQPVSLLDIYPTLSDLCGLPVGKHLEGQSLRQLLANPQTETERVVVTTHGRNNHAARSIRYRYIRYADGSEELYDHQQDPMEWNNLADKSSLTQIKTRLAAAMPKRNVPDSPYDQGKRKKNKSNTKKKASN